MRDQIKELEARALKDLEAVNDGVALEKFRVTYLGKKGLVTALMRNLGKLPPEERPEVGREANLLKKKLIQN